jgi:hypothetical protein
MNLLDGKSRLRLRLRLAPWQELHRIASYFHLTSQTITYPIPVQHPVPPKPGVRLHSSYLALI